VLIEVRGSYFNNNFGDLLLLWRTCDILERAGAKITMPMVPDEIQKLARVRAVDHDKTPGLNDRVSGVVYGGGGYLGEVGRYPYILEFRRDLRYNIPGIATRCRGIPYAVIGVGGGRIHSPLTRMLMRSFLNGADMLALRDQESIDYLKRYQVKKEPRLIGDGILCLGELKYPKGTSHELTEWRTQGLKVVGLHLTSLERMPVNEVILDVTQQQLRKNSQMRIIALLDQKGESSSNLKSAQAEARLRFGKNLCRCNTYEDPWDFVELIQGVDVIVTNKLHVAICGAALGKRVISVPTMPKTKRYFLEMGLSHLCLDKDSAGFSAEFGNLLSELLRDECAVQTAPVRRSVEASRKYEDSLVAFVEKLRQG
jgi:polysaccharide pyruvyl transferase WcaK-like protein